MGAWGNKNFENDSAIDWLTELEGNPSIDFLQETFNSVIENDDYVEVDDASAVLAAGEIVAFMMGKPSTDFPDDIINKIKDLKITTDIKQNAIKAIEKVKEDSELKELWQEGGDDEWTPIVEDLLDRLK